MNRPRISALLMVRFPLVGELALTFCTAWRLTSMSVVEFLVAAGRAAPPRSLCERETYDSDHGTYCSGKACRYGFLLQQARSEVGTDKSAQFASGRNVADRRDPHSKKNEDVAERSQYTDPRCWLDIHPRLTSHPWKVP